MRTIVVCLAAVCAAGLWLAHAQEGQDAQGVALAGLEVFVSGATVTPAVLEGDPVAGVGTVTRIDNVAINSAGSWLVEADTNNPDTDTDSVLLRDGALFLREGDPLPLPAGALLDSFDSVGHNAAGVGGFNFFLDGPPSGEDSGIYLGTDLIIQEGDVSTAPQFSPGTPYIGFFDVKNNNSNQALVVASIDDPAIASTVDRALVIVTHDGAGNLVSETVLAKEGDVLAGQVEPVADFETGPHESAFNDAGQVLFQANLAGDTSVDGTFYLDATLLAQEGGPSPVAGRNYDFLLGRGCDLNASGSYVFKASLEGSTSDDDLIVLNGAVFIREGDTLPVIAGFTFTSFGLSGGPVELDDSGNVLWYGDWNDPNTDVDTGLFLNQQLLVQEGVTLVGGVPIDTINNGDDAFQLSPDGTHVIFEATLDDGTNGAFLIELTPGENQPPVASCQDVTVEAPADACEADADVNDGSFDPDGDPLTIEASPAGPYPVGTTEVTLTVTDSEGASDSCTATVTVLDVTPPALEVVVDPDELWPPNHRMVDVTAMVVASDLCGDTAVVLESVTSNEPDDSPDGGDGHTVNDIQGADVGTADFEFRLRAERLGGGNGRVYTIVYSATDASGNSVMATATVTVDHDQGGVTEPVMISLEQTAQGTVVGWGEVAGASHFNVIQGQLDELVPVETKIGLGHVTCIEAGSLDASTAGFEDAKDPEPGEGFFYLVESSDGQQNSGYGTESAPLPRIVESGDCE